MLIIITFAVILFLGILYTIHILSTKITPRPTRISGRHVLVTGGSSGIGKAIAIEAAKGGASVTLLARNQSRLQEAKVEVEQHVKNAQKQKIICISMDVTNDFSALEEAVRHVEKEQGAIHILINCAGASSSAKFLDTSLQEYRVKFVLDPVIDGLC